LPKDFTLEVLQIDGTWEEGTGLDMEDYRDKPYGEGSTWNQAVATKTKATGRIFMSGGAGIIDLTASQTGRAPNGRFFQFDILVPAPSSVVTFTGTENSIIVNVESSVADALTSADLVELINTGAVSGKSVTVVDPDNLRTLQTAIGGNSTPLSNSGAGDLDFTYLAGGDGEWIDAGGDTTGTAETADFEIGTEDLVINVTSFVSNWLANPSSNNGLLIKLPDSASSATRSYYTKMFFGRGTSNFFKKPTLEARWNSQIRDNRKSFYNDEPNDLYLYHIVRNSLTDVVGGVRLTIVDADDNVLWETAPLGVATKVDTGIYKETVDFNTSSDTVYDVWTANATEIYRGTIEILRESYQSTVPVDDLVISVSNKRKEYSTNSVGRFYFYIREKNWSPNIYTVATGIPDTKVYDNLHYKITRVVTDEVIFDYDTENDSTILSYDSNGNFFDLDISMLEPNYVYEIKLALFNVMTKSYQELPFKHRFRVVDNEY